ncbi:hypothetical protein NL676_001650 [Syzygium grande]|nr:hypothetical protein NL676_001650 [Syzygium grande]
MVFNLRTFSFSGSDEEDPTPPKSFSLKELRDATNHFSHGNNIGGGDFGAVYRGLLADGSPVAVKRAVAIDQEREEIFEREMQVASSVSTHPNCVRTVYRGRLADGSPVEVERGREEEFFEAEIQVGSTVSTHPNVLCLRGYCRTKKELLLVYPLMINSTLYYNLRERPDGFVRPLDWTTRKQIALGAARGGSHTFTIKWWVYCPEFFKNIRCTLKVDVFSYGIMLLELISGKKISELELGYDVLMGDGDISLEERIGDSVNKLGREIDPNLQGNYVEEEAERLVRLALLCAHEDPSVRPEMSEVVRILESQFLQRDPSSRSSWSQSECDSTPYYSFPPSPSPLGIAP